MMQKVKSGLVATVVFLIMMIGGVLFICRDFFGMLLVLLDSLTDWLVSQVVEEDW